MILLVAAGEFDPPALAGYRTERVATAAAAEAALDRGEADVVVYEGDLAAVADLVARLRGGEVVEDCVPLVVVTDGPTDDLPLLALDEVLDPSAAPEQVTAAVERAHTIREYQRAVDALFDECRRRVGDAETPFEETPELRAAREEADELLEELVSDPAALGALLSTPEGDAGVAPPPGCRGSSDPDSE